MSDFPRIRPVGDRALTLEWGETLDDAVNARVRACDRALAERPFDGFLESVPTHRSLLVLYDPSRTSLVAASAALFALDAEAGVEDAGTLHVLPTLYGGDDGPDLERVAAHAGLSPAQVVARHAAQEYTARMLGFAPGFAYLGPLAPALATPRLETPRTRVPAGSVGIAGEQTAVYPAATAGGWNLIGRTSTRLFDPEAARASLIRPGDRVRFQPVAELPLLEPRPVPRDAERTPVLEVLAPGLLTSVQDAGRHGHRRYGVGRAGAADVAALAAANEAVGNPSSAAALECTVVGPRLRFLEDTTLAVAGADLGAALGGEPLPPGGAVRAAAGDELSFSGRRDGCRAYVAFAGGVDVPVVLGSRSTDLQAGFGGFLGRALRRGDRLSLAGGARTAPRRAVAARAADTVTVRVVPGPQDDAFVPGALAALTGTEWRVAPESDRAGLRLAGSLLRHRTSAEVVSDGLVPGCIQVPADGRPILVLWDGPTTGGYAKIATVVAEDLPLLAQLLPGVGRVRFERA